MSLTTERRTIATELRATKGEDGKTRLTGYAAVFNQRSVPLSAGKGKRFVETINPGAFKRSLDTGDDVPLLYGHDTKKILARTSAGTLTLREDDKGLAFEAVLPDTTLGRDVAGDVEHGNVRGMSFGFGDPKDEWAKDGEMAVRTLLDVGLGEVSATGFPAYEGTSVDVRSIDAAIEKLEGRATIEVQDSSLVYSCRYGIQCLRDAFDTCQRVIDVASSSTNLDDNDQVAIDDFLATVRDLIAKARLCKSVLMGIGAEDEGDEPDTEAAAEVAAGEDPMRSLKTIQQMTEAGMSLNGARAASK